MCLPETKDVLQEILKKIAFSAGKKIQYSLMITAESVLGNDT